MRQKINEQIAENKQKEKEMRYQKEIESQNVRNDAQFFKE